MPIITTPHAESHLSSKGEGEAFEEVHALDFFESIIVDILPPSEEPAGMKVTGMPGKHVPDGILGAANDLLKAVPPTNGWMVELGRNKKGGSDEYWECGYR